jgi:hypothetical protein
MFDNIITNLPFTFAGITNVGTTIQKSNFCSIRDIQLLDYDLILCNDRVSQSAYQLSTSFHIPIVVYVHIGTKPEIAANNNIYYVIESLSDSQNPIDNTNIVQILPIAKEIEITSNITDKDNDIIILNNSDSHMDTISNTIKQSLPGAKVVVTKETDAYNNYIELFAKSKYCIDINPRSAFNSILCGKTNTTYLVNQCEIANICKKLNNNSIIFIDYETMIKSINLNYATHTSPAGVKNTNSLLKLKNFIQYVKKQGLII